MDIALNAISHRGPDDRGFESLVMENAFLWLGNTRLAILDLSHAGHMPMQDPANGNWITHNGEIYNFLELRKELEQFGEVFQSRTDTEVILKAYARWGEGCLGRLRGMFAFAIWDQGARQLFLARDRLGKKPLYYTEGSGFFAFASEVRALLAAKIIPARLDPAGLATYLWNGFVVSPVTLIQGVHSLLPGCWMRVDASAQVADRGRFWTFPGRPPGAGTLREAVREARASLEESVRLRLISDVPLGAFLSGGMDSSAIVALMAQSGAEVRTFSVTFDEPGFDESRYSGWVAQRFSTSHTEVRLSPSILLDWLPQALGALDQPSFDGLNTYCVARPVRDAGLKVALSGLGADELFGGYPFFRSIPWLERWRRLARRSPLSQIHLGSDGDAPRWDRVAGPWKVWELVRRGADEGREAIPAYQVAQMQWPRWARTALLHADIDRAERDSVWGLPTAFLRFLAEDLPEGDGAAQISAMTLRLFLGERTLRDTDTMSMGVSLEVRAPFTDHVFVERVIQIAGRIRTRGAPNKPFEADLVRPFLGPGYPRRSKQGFIFPFEDWLRQPAIREKMRDRLQDGQAVEAAGLRAQAVRELAGAYFDGGLAIPWSRVWALFVLVDWCARHNVSP